jgi:cytochrome c-type biogenesis protein CcmH/NrfF
MFEGFVFMGFAARLSCRTGSLRVRRALRALFTPSVAAPVGRFRRFVSAGMVCLLAVVMLGATPSSRFEKVGHEMMCACGCGQILLECNHVGCPDSDRMIGELRAQVAGGGSDSSIMNWFVAKYGATILAAPVRGGFDNVAWIAPMVVFLLATLGTVLLIRMWKLRSGQRISVSVAGPNVGGDEMRERIRRETEY